MAIPTLATIAGLAAMMGSVNVEFLKGRSLLFGLAIGLLSFFILAAIKLLESNRRKHA
jgi:hypothetical protein